jgi:hypothetical protein
VSDRAPGGGSEESEPEWKRKRRLDRIFGDTMPDTTSDEREPGTSTDDGEDPGDRWLREQVPPHHG